MLWCLFIIGVLYLKKMNNLKKMTTREVIQKKIKHNQTFVKTINRFLHNEGIDMTRRYFYIEL